MDFNLSEDQRMLQDSVGRLLQDHYDFEARKTYMTSPEGWSRKQWERYAEMGLLALPFSEEDGGLGAGMVETMLVMEAFGRSLVLEPYLATVILGGGLLRLGGSASQRQNMAPLIGEGKLTLAFAQAERQSRFDLADVATSARRSGAGWILNGRKCHVINGGCADRLIVTARVTGDQRDLDGLGLFIVNADAEGVSRRAYVTQDRLRSADVTLDNVRIGTDAAIGEPGNALPIVEQVVDMATAAICAEAVGVMARAHEITVEYLKTRQQFGTAIGSFQVLQHRAVDMLINIEEARSMAMYAIMMSEEKDPRERSRAISAAKVQIGRSGKFVGEQGVQLHGGIGITEEYSIGHYFRRLTMIDQLFGNTDYHLVKLAASTEY